MFFVFVHGKGCRHIGTPAHGHVRLPTWQTLSVDAPAALPRGTHRTQNISLLYKFFICCQSRELKGIFKNNMSLMFSTLSYYFFSKGPACQASASCSVTMLVPAIQLAMMENKGFSCSSSRKTTAQWVQEGHVPTQCPSWLPL